MNPGATYLSSSYPPSSHPPSSYQPRYQHLEAFLLEYAALWQPMPFHHSQPAWAVSHPALYHALLALPDAATTCLEADATALQQWLIPFLPALARLPSLLDLPIIQGELHKAWPTGFDWDMPGRKWAQVEAFCRAVPPHTSHLLDWCAGKGHLSRSLAFQYECNVTGLEWNPALCHGAAQLSLKTRTPATLIHQDVMAPDTVTHITPQSHCVALHACGKLHLRLLTLAAQQRAAGVCFSPCCYHLIDEPLYHPLAHAEGSLLPRLVPTRDQLRLAVQETVTANGRARQLRHRKSAWRLGFRALIAGFLPTDDTPPLPSLADQYFHGHFAAFCAQAATHLKVALPPEVDFLAYEQQGWQEHRRVQRLELLRHAFRRALEIWLCLDRACWLEQQGYKVEVGVFCTAEITPRNLLISARRENH